MTNPNTPNNPTNKINYTPIIIGILAVLVIGAIAIGAMSGGDMKNNADKMRSSSMMEKTVNVGGAAMYPSKNIIDNVVNASNLSTLVTAVKAADLVDTLKSAGPFTVFGPNNDAFAALPNGTVDTLLRPEGKVNLQEILKYHVVPGKFLISDLKDGQMLSTVQGEMLKVTKTNGQVMINGAEIETGDVIQSNGVAHVIKKVLLPPSEVTVGGSAMVRTQNVVTNASKATNLSTLVTAVKAAGLVETLQGPGPFTVFAPDNNAFAKLPAGTVETLVKPESKDTLTKILTYHVVSGKYLASSLKDGQVLTTVQGQTLTVSRMNDKIMLKSSTGNTVTITQSDVIQSNGVAHVIDSVLMPQ